MLIHVLFVLLCFLIDGILMTLFPNNALGSELLFISNLGFCAMVLTIRKFEPTNAYLFAICFGMFFDHFFASSFLVYAIAYFFIAFVIHVWSKHMMDTILESIILCISTIFVKDCVVYFCMFFNQMTTLDIQTWFVTHEFLTILANAILVIILISLIRIKDDYLEMKERQVRKEEKVEWFRLKSKP